MPSSHSVLKAALTRAIKSSDPATIRAACRRAVAQWKIDGYWPDDWSAWQNALDDALPWDQHVELEDA